MALQLDFCHCNKKLKRTTWVSVEGMLRRCTRAIRIEHQYLGMPKKIIEGLSIPTPFLRPSYSTPRDLNLFCHLSPKNTKTLFSHVCDQKFWAVSPSTLMKRTKNKDKTCPYQWGNNHGLDDFDASDLGLREKQIFGFQDYEEIIKGILLPYYNTWCFRLFHGDKCRWQNTKIPLKGRKKCIGKRKKRCIGRKRKVHWKVRMAITLGQNLDHKASTSLGRRTEGVWGFDIDILAFICRQKN